MNLGAPIAVAFWTFVGGVGVCGLWEDARRTAAKLRDRIDGRDRRHHIDEMRRIEGASEPMVLRSDGHTITVTRPSSLTECQRIYSLPTSTEAND